MLPGESEVLPRQDQVTRLLPTEIKIYGSLWISNFRITFKSTDPEVCSRLSCVTTSLNCVSNTFSVFKFDATLRDFEVTIGSIKSIRKIKPSENSGVKSQSILKILTFDFQSYQICFPLNSGGNNRTLSAIENVINPMASLGVTFASSSLENWEPSKVLAEACWTSGLPTAELERLGVFSIDEFRLSECNSKFKLSHCYPPSLVAPNSASDEQMETIAGYREAGQFPIVTWRSVTGGMLLMRAASNMNSQLSDDEMVVVRLMMLKSPNRALRILDVGPKRTYSVSKQYSQFIPEHLELPPLSQVEDIFEEVMDLLNTGKDMHIISTSNSEWSSLLSRYMEQVLALSRFVDSGTSLMLQGSRKYSGHLVLLTILQIVCDPRYRTLAGLCILLEKEWVQFTFPFRDHVLSREHKGELPAFELTIHIIWMLTQAHPTFFEYGEKTLSFILDNLFSCRFVTFCAASRKDLDRLKALHIASEGSSATPNATSIWSYLQTHAKEFISPAFQPSNIPSEYWLNEPSGPLGAPPTTSINATGSKNVGLCPYMLQIETLATLPIIWRERFLQYDWQLRYDASRVSALAKPGYGGNSIFFLSPQHRSLCHIPPKIWTLPGLTTLHFKNAMLTSPPMEIINAPTLEDFSLAGNPIRHLPEDWLFLVGSKLRKLRILDFDKTSIGHVVLSAHQHILSLQTLRLGSMERLHPEKGLEIAMNIPKWPLAASLEELELPSNGLSSLPPRFVNLVCVASVDLSGNKFNNIPLQLECFTRLSKLNFADNLMTTIIPPQGGFRMNVLSALNLAGNGLEAFPEHLGNLPALRSLSLARNNLTDLSQRFFMQFKLLDILDLSSNKLTQLSPAVGYLGKLSYFDVSGNSLSFIPDTIVGMTSLKYLDLSYNKLPSLSVCFGRMKSLNTLKISYNSMTVLPPHLGSLRDTLQTFDFTGNELVTPPMDILKGGSKAVLDFLYDSLSGSKSIYRMKMMIVGEENVGKTTLVDQLTRRWKAASSDGIYEPISTLSTDGIAISTCSFHWKNDGEKKNPRLADEFDVNISWWDFAGQELYYTTHQFFLSGRSIFVVVWNLEKPIEDSRVDFWLNSIQSKISNATVVLVGTHLDGLKGPAKDAVPDLFKQTKLRLRMLFPSLDIIAYAASARTGEGMADLKDALEKKIVASKHMGETIPSSYLLLERMVTDARVTHQNLPIVSKHKFLEMSSMCNISGEKELFRASNLLHNLGTLIYFEQDLVLSRYVILDPQWLAKLMCTLITTKHSFVTAGVISHRALAQVWREFPLAMYGFLLGLLEKFEVTYNLTGFIDPTSLSNPTALQLIALNERYNTGADSKKSKQSKKKAGPTKTVMMQHQLREWLHALIPMLKRHPNVVIGNSVLRRIGSYASSGLLQAGSRTTVADLQSPNTSPNSVRVSTPPIRRVASALFDEQKGAEMVESASKRYSPNVQKILERGDVVGSFDLDGVSLIPSLLPQNPPPHFESRNMFPAKLGPGEMEVTRDYLFDFVPEGLLSRLTVRLLQRFLDQTKEFVMWREGILLIRSDCILFAHFVQPRQESRVLRLHCRGSDFLAVGRVFSAALEANSILFKEWSRLRVQQEVICPHCLANPGIQSPSYFPLEVLMDAVRDDVETMACSIMYLGANGEEKLETVNVPLEKLTPDFKLVYLTGAQIKYSDLHIDKEIGVGGFAVVYKGTYKNEQIAIKQLRIGSSEDSDQGASVTSALETDPEKKKAELEAISADEYARAFNEFRKEAFMLTDIADPYCVRMTGVCLKPFCLVTEFMPCGDLYSLCHRSPEKEISWPLRLRIALDMAKGMHFLHSLRPPIIHNDLKSPNVLLSSMDPDAPIVAKISDFGLSMRMSKMYTRLVDNPVWIAPEIMRGATYDTKADVYAYGVMLWEMLERRGFFEEVVFNSELERKVMAGERPVIENDTLPEYEKLIRACWDNDPLRRPPFENIAALLEQLIDAYRRGLTKVGPSSEMALPEAQRGRRAGAEKPAFRREHSVKSPDSSPPMSSAIPRILEPEFEVLPPPKPKQEEPAPVEVKETAPTTSKVRINVGTNSRKAPSRADIKASAGSSSTEPVTITVPETVVTPELTSPVSPPSDPAKLTSIDRLNLLLGRPAVVELPVSPRNSESTTAAPASVRLPAPAASSIPSTPVTQSLKLPPPASKSAPEPKLDPTPIASTSPSPAPKPVSPTLDPSANTLKPPMNAAMKFQLREGGRPVSLKTALNGSITGLLSSLQSLTDASGFLSAQEELDNSDDQPPALMDLPKSVLPTSIASSSDSAPVTPPIAASPTPTPTPTPTSSTTALLAGLAIISEVDAKRKLAELNESLRGLVRVVVAMTSGVKNQDPAVFQAAVMDTVKFVRAFRETAGVPAGFKAVNPTLNERLLLLRNSLKALCSQILTLLQTARLLLKKDPAVTQEAFAANASSFVAAFKLTTGVLEMIKLDGVQVLEVEPVDLTS